MSVILILFLVTFLGAAYYFKDDILSMLNLTPPTSGGGGDGDGDGGDGEDDEAADEEGEGGDGADGDGADGDGGGGGGGGGGGTMSGTGTGTSTGTGTMSGTGSGPDLSCLTRAYCQHSSIDDGVICAGSTALTFVNGYNPTNYATFRSQCNSYCPGPFSAPTQDMLTARQTHTTLPTYTCTSSTRATVS